MSEDVLFRDAEVIQPPDELYADSKNRNIYGHVAAPRFIACAEDIWLAKQLEVVEEKEDNSDALNLRARADAAFRKKALDVLDHPAFLIFFAFATFWALFADDVVYVIKGSKGVDIPFAWISFIFMGIFSIEQCVRTYLDPPYACSFFWWIDIAGTGSMFNSILPIMIGCQVGSTASLGPLLLSRLGRIMRLFRVIRVVKVLQKCFKRKVESEEEGEKAKEAPPSAVGKRLNELIIKEVILMTLALMFISPNLSVDEEDRGREVTFRQLVSGFNYSSFPAQLASYEATGEEFSDSQLLHVKIDGKRAMHDFFWPRTLSEFPDCFMGQDDPAIGCPGNVSELRCSFLEKYTFQGHVVIWNNSIQQRQQALKNILLTVFLIAVLFVMFTGLSNDVTSLVVRPIESMVDIVHKLAQNPTLQLEGQSKSKYETEAVRVALAKIVGLMQLGFGGAGHEIISANLANSESAQLDLMIRGKKKECAYGFCDIRQFTDTVECLQDQVMLFTNSVSEIIHQACNDNKGEPNKNIGDAFLIVWRPKSMHDHTKIVDGALTSFRRCVREVASSQTLQLVTNVEAIHKKFGRDKYRTKIGFGLHFGWSVEGPVGSPKKIDCSYLSPEVKISDRLEAATKIYSSNILMSGQFYDLLSDHIKVGIRLIDHITLKGGHKPFRVYADDRSNLWLKMNPRLIEIYGAEAAYEQFSKTFHEGIDAFIKGDWPTAQQKLEGAADFCPEDTPTRLLMKEMKSRSIDPSIPTAPVDWKGYHDSDV
ncbi:hypothetical protein AB1Y20_011491 [Prymnesium parvum]